MKLWIYLDIYSSYMRQIRLIDTLWAKLWHAPWDNKWKTARAFYQYSKFHVLTDKNQSIINWWLSNNNNEAININPLMHNVPKWSDTL